jgi:hypothetical protein
LRIAYDCTQSIGIVKGEKSMKKAVIFGALTALTWGLTWGADIDGKWTVQTQGRNGAQTQTLTLKFDGAALTGSLDGGRGGAVEITEGKMDGANVSFKVTRAGRNGGNQTTTYTGTLSGDDLKLTRSGGGGGGGRRGGGRGGPQELAFKRVK